MPLETPNTEQAEQAVTPTLSPSGFGPLRIPLFRDRWIASTISSLGTWMQDTAGTWLMTALTTSPLLIALMQTAAALPVLLLGLLAGATADIFDRRRLLIFWQAWMLLSVAILAVLTLMGHISPWALLAFTFLLNIGSAMNNPAWQAIVPELVPREFIPDSVSLNSASNNIARALGPALGGLMVAAFTRTDTGAGYVFVLNSISFAGVIWVLVNWKRVPLFKSALPSERIAGSIRSGLRYVRYAPDLRASLIRAYTFPFFVSAIWALLAVVASRDLKQGALGYGILNGALGIGALIAATLLPRIRQRVPADRLIAANSLYNVATMLILAFVRSPAIIIVILVFAGFTWTSTMATLNTSVQLSVPAWVKARALGTYFMTFQAGMAFGSILWGFIAEHSSTPISLTTAACGLLITLPLVHRFKVLEGPAPDHTPYQWKRPAPELTAPIGDEADFTEGPVRISVEYIVPIHSYAEFTRAIHQLRGVRLRDGAIRWGVFRDAIDPTHINESFVMESWLDYLRSRERVTLADRKIQDAVYALHHNPIPNPDLDSDRDPDLDAPHTVFLPPKVTHQLYAREIANPTPHTAP
jgi:MFS family permease